MWIHVACLLEDLSLCFFLHHRAAAALSPEAPAMHCQMFTDELPARDASHAVVHRHLLVNFQKLVFIIRLSSRELVSLCNGGEERVAFYFNPSVSGNFVVVEFLLKFAELVYFVTKSTGLKEFFIKLIFRKFFGNNYMSL
jgi:hypothetical protein